MDNQAFELIRDKLDELGKIASKNTEAIDEIKKDLRHYKGFIGGVLFVFTALWSIVLTGINHLFKNHT